MSQLYIGEPFFDEWKAIPYRFESDEAKERFASIVCNEQGGWIDYDLFHHIRRVFPDLDMTQSDLSMRSKYTPDMLRKHCDSWQEGGKMGNYDSKLLSKAFQKVLSKYRLKQKVQPMALTEVPFKSGTNFGAPTFANTRDDDTARDRAIALAKAVLKGKCPEPFSMYHRGKDAEQVRIVMAEPKEMYMIAGMFYYRFYEATSHLIEPSYAGSLKKLQLSARLNSLQWQSRFVLCADYSKFDSTIPRTLSSMAFKVIRSCFEMNAEEEAAWEKYVKFFQMGGVLAPDGMIYVGRKWGTPSGSLFTTPHNCIVNDIVIEYAALRLSAHIADHTVVGDDSAIGLLDPITPSEFCAVAAELGIRVDVKSTTLKLASEPIYFLGHYWDRGCSRRPIEETVKRLCCPEMVENWRRKPFGHPKYVVGLIDKIKDYQNDNADFWELGNIIIDSIVNPEIESRRYGRVTRGRYMYTNQRVDTNKVRLSGLNRVLVSNDVEPSSTRLRAVF